MPTLLNDCGCCEGITAIVPAEVFNRPGQPRVRYRAGTHGEFLASALAALSDPGFAALRELTTRDPDDFTIALLDSWAVVADVLTFYQERIANEWYLRTATERQSILELARLIGYTLRPGVAASTYLAFILEDAPGAPKRTTIDVRTKVQSIPGLGEQPQIFETIEAIDARGEWNALRPQTTRLIVPGKRDKSTYLRGLATNLRPGDALLFVGTEREADPKNENWDFRLLTNVEADEENGRTRVTWEDVLGDSPHTVPAANPRVYAFRQRAAIFGYNAPEWRTIPDTTKALYLGLDDPRELIDEVLINGVPYSEKKEWPNFTIFAPTSKPKPQPVPDREIQPTRESVAAAATAAAAIQVANAVKLATDAANDAEAAAQTAQNAVQPAITAAEAAATIPLHAAIVAAKNAVAAANADTEMNAARDDILDQALSFVPVGVNPTDFVWDPSATPRSIANATDVYFAKNYEIPGLKSDIGGGADKPSYTVLGVTTQPWDLSTQRANIATNLQKIADTIKTAADRAIDNAETDIHTNAIPAAAQAAFAPFTALISASQTFATKARKAAAVTQTAVIIAVLIKAVLELPENLRPPDANTMAIVIDAIADLAANATFRGDSLTSPFSLAGLSPQANAALATINATNLGSAVQMDAVQVGSEVKKAVAEALKPVKLPRPARRDIFEPYQDTIDLDAIYQRITPESWLVLSTPTYQEVYKITRVVEAARSEFSLTAKTTRVTLEGENLKHVFEKEVRTTTVFAQSEELEIVETPLREPLYGARIALSQLAPDLKPKQALAVSGKRAQVIVTAKSVRWVPTDGSNPVMLQPGEVLSVMAPPRVVSGSMALTPEHLVEVLDSSPPETIQWQLMDRDGSTGSVTEPSNLIKLHTAADDDPIVNEIAFIGTPAGTVSSTRERTIITLRAPLQNCYDRATVAIYASVAASTHGETTKNEVLGSGNASQPFQQFVLKQSPLTYIRSTSPSGADSTLEVRVNDVRWQEVSTLYGHGRNEHIYSTLRDDAGRTTIEFGDGLRGARLPTGQENVTATYRKGLGTDGNVKAGQLRLLMSRPLGVRAVTNPLAAEGGDDRESLANARQNAPRTVLTFDRVVSLQDYEDFSRGFAGIAKALATWTWDGRTRGVFITVAGPFGVAISDALAQDLITAIHNAGDPFVPVRVESYDEVLFKLAGKIKVNPDYEAEKVLKAATDALREEFSFANRNFGQPVVLSEVIALLQNVAGVVAVDLDSLYRTGQAVQLNSRLEAELPNGGDPASLNPAELLTLDPAPIDWEVIP